APTLPGDPRIRLPPASLRRYDDKEMDGLSPPSDNSSASWRTRGPPTDVDLEVCCTAEADQGRARTAAIWHLP
ncbi:MAG: hypothetical protein M3R66_14745, partial [Actinomycetota bacterium]|nr:hypothetical protein [Actinomycetota bacterium]